MHSRQTLSEWLYWIPAVALGLAPAVIATDFGGILPWTQHVSSIALLLACLVIALARATSIGCPGESRISPAAFSLTALLLGLTAYTALQTIELPQGFVAWASPASHAAHVHWAGQLIGIQPDQRIPISIAAFDSRHGVAYLTIIAAVSFFAVLTFQRRDRITWLLSAIAIGACSVALIGILRRLLPGFQLWSFREGGEGAPFGSFFNRNNAALAINLGIGSALGLVFWRMSAFSPSGTPANRNSLRNVYLLGGLLLVATCLVGLIACGSRGGLLSLAIAGSATFAMNHKRFGRIGGVVAAAALVAIAVFALLRTDTLGNQALRGDTLEQLESTVGRGSNRLATDTRLAHWPDGFRTAVKHFPAGSGLASYGYAYLPWQQTSPWRHCLHADNLWLEMLVELGLPGLILLALLVTLITRALIRLGRSSDPIDQGLWITGCYVTLTIGISQCFDFGLILPTNLIATTILLSVVIARASTVIVAGSATATSSNTAKGNKPKLVLLKPTDRWWKSPIFLKERLLQGVAAAGLVALSIPAITRLQRDSSSDHVVRTATVALQSKQTTIERIDSLATEISQQVQQHAHPDLLDVLTELEFHKGRLVELALRGAINLPADRRAELYASTSRARRRLGWRMSVPELSPHVTDAGQSVAPLPLNQQLRNPDSPYVRSVMAAEASLRKRPLALEPRMNQVFLEFVHESPERTKLAINQSSRLFRNTPELQLRFGATAANHGDYDAAVTAWSRATELDERMITRVLGRALRLPDFPLRAVVPDTPAGQQKADEFLKQSRRR